MVDWTTKTDFLRCNPNFWGHPRYDFAITNSSSQGKVFVHLVFLFTYQVGSSIHPLALVQALEKHPRPGTTKGIDKKLSIHRWNIHARNRCEVIPMDHLIRGAVLVPDDKYAGDHLVIDTLDADMFLRVKALHQS